MTDGGVVTWESLLVGEGPPAREQVPVTLTELVRYQGASGAMHPVHFDPAYAQAQGYPKVLSVGMLHASQLASMATDWLGAENIRFIQMRFKDAVWLHDCLNYSCTVLRKYLDRGERKVDVALLCAKQNGRSAVEISATFVVEPVQAGPTAHPQPSASS